MEIKEVNVNDLIPYEFNNKIHNREQVNRIANSIKEFWFLQPLVIDKNNILIVWHGRLEWAKKLWLKTVPCVYADNLTEQQIKKYRILDNKLNESERDIENLKLELDELPDLNIWELELDVKDLFPELVDQEEENEIVEDEAPEVQKEAKMVRGGDLFILWNHRLLCWDSTKIEDVEMLMDGTQADMVFTDPPYWVSYTGGMKMEDGKIESNGKNQIKNDNLDYDNLYKFLYDVFVNIKMHTISKSAFYIFYTHSRTREFLNALHDAWLRQRSIIIWYKTSWWFWDFMAQYMNAYEPCIYWSNWDCVNRYWPTNEKTIREIDKEKKCDLHPTMKPIAVVSRAVKNSSKKWESVLDLFGGSWSTLIACEQLDRKCYMMELDPKYIEVIIKRFHNINPGAEIKCLNRDLDLNQLRDEDK